MQVVAADEMADVIRCALTGLDPIEATFVGQYYLRDPRVMLPAFDAQWELSAKAMSDLRSRVLARMKELLVAQNITSVGDI
jgi:hypothetical protein